MVQLNLEASEVIAIGAAAISSLLSIVALFVARGANFEERKSRNVEAVFSLHQRSMAPEMARARGQLLYGTRFDSVAAQATSLLASSMRWTSTSTA